MSRRRRVRDEEAALWRSVSQDVRPLRGETPKEPPPNETPDEPDAAVPEPPSAPAPRAAAAAPRRAAPAALPPLSAGTPAGLDKRAAQRLRRGQTRPEARLDLHGMTQKAAHAALARFIRGSRAEGRRCVLVITGKGSVASGLGGVLRQMVPRWLNEPGLRREIIAISHAQPRDGGQGALYVLLKRTR